MMREWHFGTDVPLRLGDGAQLYQDFTPAPG